MFGSPAEGRALYSLRLWPTRDDGRARTRRLAGAPLLSLPTHLGIPEVDQQVGRTVRVDNGGVVLGEWAVVAEQGLRPEDGRDFCVGGIGGKPLEGVVVLEELLV